MPGPETLVGNRKNINVSEEFHSEKDQSFAGLILGGLTIENLDHFEPINPEVISSFSVMVAQAVSLLRNYQLKRKLKKQNLQLEKYSKNLTSLVEERTKELRQANKELDLLCQKSIGNLHLTREELSYQELLAQTDELTGLRNRRSMDAQLKKLVELSLATDEQFGLLLLDLDNFKLTNDKYGHPKGDLVLKEVAQLLRTSCRHTDLLYRWGGDEFAVIMPGISMTRGREVAEQIRSRIDILPAIVPNTDFTVTASLGGTLHMPPERPSELISRVDEYLYQAKRNGRNQIVWKDKTSGEQTAKRKGCSMSQKES